MQALQKKKTAKLLGSTLQKSCGVLPTVAQSSSIEIGFEFTTEFPFVKSRFKQHYNRLCTSSTSASVMREKMRMKKLRRKTCCCSICLPERLLYSCSMYFIWSTKDIKECANNKLQACACSWQLQLVNLCRVPFHKHRIHFSTRLPCNGKSSQILFSPC